MIQKQIKLSWKIAFDVTLQGIRIRLGRSLITLAGVMLGIAFLMSILTAIAARRAVSSEENIRLALRQMYNFLIDEIGSVQGRSVGVIQLGKLSETETRFFLLLIKQGAGQISWFTAAGQRPRLEGSNISETDLKRIADQASVVIITGEYQKETEIILKKELFELAGQKVLALTRKDYPLIKEEANLPVIQLLAEVNDEIKQKLLAEARINKYRNIWIIIISIIVTIIGIGNSMLMSVTERFREIGTMKCLGALSAFIKQMFFFEAMIIGCIGATGGALFGGIFTLFVYGISYGFGTVFLSVNYVVLFLYCLATVFAGTLMALIAAIYPAQYASAMVPAVALRSNI